MSTKKTDTNTLAEVAFDDALAHMSALPEGSIDALISDFEAASSIDDDGIEYWTARDLQKLLGYSDYRNFLNIVNKAKDACINSGNDIQHHFVDVTDMIEVGKGATREIDNIKLTRYASYLIAQNGDSRKEPVAFAQTYFAIQTRKQEVQEDDIAQYTPLSEDQKRVLLRNEIKEHNKNLASAAKDAGVVAPLDFAIFQTFGYKGLYGGLDRIGIQGALKFEVQHFSKENVAWENTNN